MAQLIFLVNLRDKVHLRYLAVEYISDLSAISISRIRLCRFYRVIGHHGCFADRSRITGVTHESVDFYSHPESAGPPFA